MSSLRRSNLILPRKLLLSIVFCKLLRTNLSILELKADNIKYRSSQTKSKKLTQDQSSLMNQEESWFEEVQLMTKHSSQNAMSFMRSCNKTWLSKQKNTKLTTTTFTINFNKIWQLVLVKMIFFMLSYSRILKLVFKYQILKQIFKNPKTQMICML